MLGNWWHEENWHRGKALVQPVAKLITYCLYTLPLTVVLVYTSNCNAAFAQIVGDGTSGSQVTSTGAVDQITGGITRGTNLFHSFQEFNVGNERSVLFNSFPGIVNILTRVTGTNPSNILGTLGVVGSNANLFLMNPNGISFGANAHLSLNGSFIATTANAIQFPSGDIFSANRAIPLPSSVLDINPNALLFNQLAARSITNQSVAGLNVTNGRSLLLVGGDVSLDGGRLQAPGGRIELAGVAGTGIVGLTFVGNNFSLDFPQNIARADVSLTHQAQVNVAAKGGGSIAINARNINILAGSNLFGGVVADFGTPSPKAGDTTLNATGTTTIDNSSILNFVVLGGGNGGNIRIDTGQLRVRDGVVATNTFSDQGRAGSLLINASDSVDVTATTPDATVTIYTPGGSISNAPIGLFTAPIGSGGSAGSLTINTGQLVVQGGAEVAAGTDNANRGGDVTIHASNLVQLIGTAPNGFPSIVASGTQGQGASGDITIDTKQLIVRDGALITTGTSKDGAGGNLTVRASDSVQLIGTSSKALPSDTVAGLIGVSLSQLFGSRPFPSGLITGTAGTGKAGNLTIETGRLTIQAGAQASTSTVGAGNAGNLSVQASATELSGISKYSYLPSALQVGVAAGSTGNGGTLQLSTDSLLLANGAQLNANTAGAGNAGNIRVNADSVSLSSGSLITAAVSSANAVGNGGDLTINARSLSLTSGAVLVASTTGYGDAGNINLNVSDSITLSGVGGSFALSSGISSRVESTGVGKGGDIDIATGSLTLNNGARITASTIGTGNAGNITIHAASMNVEGIGSNGFSSGVSSAVASSAHGNGGNLKITTGSLSVTNGAVVAASTSGQGNGGNIIVNTNTLAAASGGQVLTTSLGSGRAGNITINATDSINLAGSNSANVTRLNQFGPNKVLNVGSTSGIFANTSETSTGQGGNLSITTGTLMVQDQAQVAASSQGLGDAGSLAITASSIKLDNQGKFTTETRSRNGGNITVNAQDLLLLRHGSEISTSAGTAQAGGDGGNITINSPLIVAVPIENSDIQANAFIGKGGNVQIRTSGIFGTQFRPQPTALSDITASSELGVQGTVQINVLEVNPSQALTKLPTQVIDASSQIAQNCSAPGKTAPSTFTITGRGGLPDNPNQSLSTDAVWADLRPTPQTITTHTSFQQPTAPTPVQASKLVEAQGWVVNDKGKVVLTAAVPTATSMYCR